MKAHSSLAWAAAYGMLHAVAGEHAGLAVVQPHREVHHQLAMTGAQHLAQAVVQVQVRGGQIELAVGYVEEIGLVVASGCSLGRQTFTSQAVTLRAKPASEATSRSASERMAMPRSSVSSSIVRGMSGRITLL